MIVTKYGITISQEMLQKYLSTLIDRFFKILPLRESEEPSLFTYMTSLMVELIGCSELIHAFHDDPEFLTLVSILQYMIDHPDSPVRDIKREVFHAIAICKKLEQRYLAGVEVKEGRSR